MAKLSDGNIQKKDIEEYLNNYSDFSFEIKVLKKLTSKKHLRVRSTFLS
jgi:hypothetical protein